MRECRVARVGEVRRRREVVKGEGGGRERERGAERRGVRVWRWWRMGRVVVSGEGWIVVSRVWVRRVVWVVRARMGVVSVRVGGVGRERRWDVQWERRVV